MKFTGVIPPDAPQAYLKICLSEIAISQLNGPTGNGLDQLARETSVYTKLGFPGDVFPVLLERCLSMSGDQNAIITFLWNMAVRAPDVMTSLTLVLPNSAVSAIIGHGGCTIKSLQEESGARIKVENRMDGVKERIVKISHTNGASVFKALGLVMNKIASDPQVSQHMHVSYTDAATLFQQYMVGAAKPAIPPPPSSVFATGVSIGGRRPAPMSTERKRKLESNHTNKNHN